MDLQKAKQQFLLFANQYDSKNPKVSSRIDHTFRVMNNCEQIAKKKNLTTEQIKLASLIGLLHDIGKFEGLTKGKEATKEHGDLGVEILLQNNFLRKYIEENAYDAIILAAIKNHSKLNLEQNLSKEEMLFCKLIRDADKLDIFYEAAEIFWKDAQEEFENSTISNEVKSAIDTEKIVERKQGNKFEGADRILHIIGFVYDLNYRESFEILKESKNIYQIFHRFEYHIPETKEKMKVIEEHVNEYIRRKSNSYEERR